MNFRVEDALSFVLVHDKIPLIKCKLFLHKKVSSWKNSLAKFSVNALDFTGVFTTLWSLYWSTKKYFSFHSI